MATMAVVCGTNAILRTFVPSSKDLRVATPLGNHRCTSPISGKKSCQKSLRVQAFFDVGDDPIVKEALKEPVAFLGGVFAGLLRLDLNEEPLREWVAKTAEAAGIKTEEVESASSDGGPNEIPIE